MKQSYRFSADMILDIQMILQIITNFPYHFLSTYFLYNTKGAMRMNMKNAITNAIKEEIKARPLKFPLKK